MPTRMTSVWRFGLLCCHQTFYFFSMEGWSFALRCTSWNVMPFRHKESDSYTILKQYSISVWRAGFLYCHQIVMKFAFWCYAVIKWHTISVWRFGWMSFSTVISFQYEDLDAYAVFCHYIISVWRFRFLHYCQWRGYTLFFWFCYDLTGMISKIHLT